MATSDPRNAEEIGKVRNATIVRVSRVAVGASAAGTVIATSAVLVTGHGGIWIESFGAIAVFPAIFLAAFVWIVVERQPRNRVVWIMALCSGIAGLYTLLSGALVLSVSGDPATVDLVLANPYVPADLPRHAAWLRVISDPIGTIAFMIWLTYGLLLFPDGTLPSPKLRWLAWLSGIGLTLTTVGFVRIARPWSTVPVENGVLFDTGLFVLFVAMALTLGTLFMRLRSSEGAQRQQLKWVVWGAAVFVPAVVISVFLGGTRYQGLAIASFALGEIVVLISYGIAVGRYRLYDIDIVISRSLMFIGLAGVITLIYSALVVGIGSRIGGSSTWLSVLATVIVAVMFEPARNRLQRWVNRIVYGRRATPYEVLSDLTGRLAKTESTEGLLHRMATRLMEGTGADSAAVWVAADGGFRLAASSNGETDESVEGLDAIDGTVVPVVHEGNVLGALSIEKRRGETLTPTERSLVDDLAGSAGLLLRRRRLDADLEQTAAELSDSRRRLVDAQDVERRRLERELHVGPEQQVLALKLGLADAEKTARTEGTDRTALLLHQVSEDAQHAIEQIRSLAQGIYPPLLESDGLGSAIQALADRTALDIRTAVSVDQRYPLPVEAAVYFCVSEGLTNAAKHGEAPIEVRVFESGGGLGFEVVDSGPGFDPYTGPRGSGLSNMADRIDALGGTFTIESSPGTRTAIRGTAPVSVPAGA